jgi:hypothetical protein
MCGRYSITLPPEVIRQNVRDALRTAELARLLQRPAALGPVAVPFAKPPFVDGSPAIRAQRGQR